MLRKATPTNQSGVHHAVTPDVNNDTVTAAAAAMAVAVAMTVGQEKCTQSYAPIAVRTPPYHSAHVAIALFTAGTAILAEAAAALAAAAVVVAAEDFRLLPEEKPIICSNTTNN